MDHIKYIVKLGIVTAIVIMVMQIKVGNYTLETHTETFIRTSSITDIVRDVATGGFVFAKDVYHTTAKTLDSFFTKNFRSENSPGRRKLVEMKRSLGFQSEQERKEEKMKEQSKADEMENSEYE